MNETLQKRIEGAKKKIIQEYVESLRYENGMEVEPAVKIFLDKIGSAFFEYGISFALQNQWISIEEALPEYEEEVFVRFISRFPNSTDEFEVGYCTRWRTLDKSVKTDSKEFSIIGNMEITHWMPIPQIGGEK